VPSQQFEYVLMNISDNVTVLYDNMIGTKMLKIILEKHSGNKFYEQIYRQIIFNSLEMHN